MKETRFIAQNKQKWQEAETLLDSEIKDPEKLGNLFTQVIDDLSYSRTYYPNRSVRVYLNKIARQYFTIIYSHKKERHNQFRLFWLDELPQIILYSRRELLISLLVFLLSLAIGVFSSVNDPQFAHTILGDDYIEMTDKNIASGDPMAVYKQSNEVDMFLGITFNNLMVAFRTYVLGIFLGIGTLASLLSNGIMVGCFQYYFVQQNLFAESAITIWLHGTLEISSIVLAGGAGLTLASGLIFPGTYSRLESLQISGIRSLKLMLGISPIFILAAVIESFLTRYTDAPVFLKASLIFLSAAFIIGYFVIYPWIKSKSGFQIPIKDMRLRPANHEPLDLGRIKNNADLLKDTFRFYARYSSRLLPWVFMASVTITAASVFFEEASYIVIESEWWESLFTNMLSALATPSPLFILINSLGATLILYRTMMLVDSESRETASPFNLQSFLQILLISLVIFSLIYLGTFGILFLLAGVGVMIFTAFVQLTEQANVMYGFARAWDLFGKNQTQGLSLQFILLLLTFSLLLFLSAPLIYMHLTVLQWNFVTTDAWAQKTFHFLEIFIRTFTFYLVLPLTSVGMSYLYFSQEEVATAANLKEAVAKMGLRTQKSSKR